ncbi:MAG: helix-turn-helix domain-containing protein [Agriterribacter sp.]
MGTRLKEQREAYKWEVEDIAEMTGFSANTIRAIENGRECNISYLIEIAFAIGIHPKDIFDVDLTVKSRYKLSAKRKEKTRLTSRINELLHSNFFSTPRFVKDVLFVLAKEYKAKTTASSVSVILLRLVDQGYLSNKRQGRQNMYFTKK